MERPTFGRQTASDRVAAVGLNVVNENNVLSGMLPVRPDGSQTSTALDVSLATAAGVRELGRTQVHGVM